MTTAYNCLECGKTFDEPRIIRTSYEAYYDAPVPGYTPLDLSVCPYCGSEEIDETYESEDEDGREEDYS